MAIGMPYSERLRSAMVGTAILATAAATAQPPSVDPVTATKILQEAQSNLQPNKFQIRPGGTAKDVNQFSTLTGTEVPVSAHENIEKVVTQKAEDPREIFRRLVAEWKAGRNPTAVASRMVNHAAYRSIIRMGPIATGMVLEELRREPDEWFYALAKLTGEKPVPDACRGRFPQMVDAWLQWGKKNGYLAG